MREWCKTGAEDGRRSVCQIGIRRLLPEFNQHDKPFGFCQSPSGMEWRRRPWRTACAAVCTCAPKTFEVWLAKTSEGTEGRGLCFAEARFPKGGIITGGVHHACGKPNTARQLEKNGDKMSWKHMVRKMQWKFCVEMDCALFCFNLKCFGNGIKNCNLTLYRHLCFNQN